ncbi:MAG: nitrite reductase small subunit NirD [Actinomycetota bacterium]|nr:nitrite reductase small subunit NirD [Actinomycetota bacterium]
MRPSRAGAVATEAWVRVCPVDRLEVERGTAALMDAGLQVALFRLHTGEVLAVQNRDPFTGAYVLSRGIVGTRRGRDVVASPMHKQAFDLRTGRCLDDDTTTLTVYPVRVRSGVVEVRVGAPW